MMENKEYIDSVAAALRRKGVTFQIIEAPVDPNGDPSITTGSVYITAVPELEQLVMQFFVLSKPCFFEGCDKLRAAYKKDLEAIPADCASCAEGRIINKYEDIVREHIQKSRNGTQPANPRPVAIPGPAVPSGERTGRFKTMLRRMAKGAKALFKTSTTEAD